jgi:hypothetical protein
MDISSQLVRSVRYWPLDTGLQIDLFCDQNQQICASFTQLGGYFPEWIREVSSITAPIADLAPWTKKEITALFQQLKPKEMFELVPYGEQVHFDVDDIVNYRNHSNVELEMLSKTDHDSLVGQYLRTTQALPVPRYIHTADLMQVIYENIGSTMRVILSPMPDEEAEKVRLEAFKHNPNLQNQIDLNCSVVNVRCFIGSRYQVPVGLKRLATSLATDTELAKLDKQEINSIWKDPLSSSHGYARLCTTAAAFIRLPVVDTLDVPSQKKNKMVDAFKLIELQKAYFKDFEEKLLEKTEQMIDEKIAKAQILGSFLEKDDLFSDIMLNAESELEELRNLAKKADIIAEHSSSKNPA